MDMKLAVLAFLFALPLAVVAAINTDGTSTEMCVVVTDKAVSFRSKHIGTYTVDSMVERVNSFQQALIIIFR